MRINLAVSSVATTLLAAAAIAPQAARSADIPAPPLKAAAPGIVPVPATNWTGFYVNGGGGYGLWAADSRTSGGYLSATSGLPIPVDATTKTVGGKGWLGRAGGGFDYEFTPSFVAGVFGDFDFSDIRGTVHDAVVGLSGEIKQNWAWAGGARAGWLVTPDIMSFWTAGYTSAHFSSANMVAFSPGGASPVGVPSGYVLQPFTQSGWFLGGGVETSLGQGLFWRNEYRYAYYGDHAIQDLNVFSPNPTRRFNDVNFKPTVQTFTTQLVYKFGAGFGGPAYAASVPPPANWTGLYANGGIGYGLWTADVTSAPAPGGLATTRFAVPQQSGGKGWLGRVGGGYDHQFAPRFVAGVFADFDGSSLKGNVEDTLVAGTIKQTWSWAAGGRAGLVVTPHILGYVNGGYTNAHFSSATMNVPGCLCLPFSGTSTPDFTQNGWFVGGGTEYALAFLGSGFFWRNEYRYAQYGTQTLSDTVPGTTLILNNINFKPTVQTITTQLVYKFN